MNLEFLKTNAAELARFAAETAERASSRPDDWLLAAAAKNQADAAQEALQLVQEAEGELAAAALEWRLIGSRVKYGHVPMGLLAKLADPLNKLLLRAAYFARNQEEPAYGTGDDFANELNLKLAAIAPGSARLFIVGNASPDTTGSSALTDGIEHLFATFASAKEPKLFYDSVTDLGERAADALHDALKALETEECSLEMKWYSADGFKIHALRYDEVIQMRALLDSTKDPVIEERQISGLISLLAATGRLQVLQETGEKTTVRFRPKVHGDFVAGLRLGQYVTLSTTATVIRDPVSGEETRHYRLKAPQLH